PPERPAGASPAPSPIASPAPDSPVPGELEPMVTWLMTDKSDTKAVETYEAGGERFVAYCREHMDDLALQLLLAKFLIHTKQAEEARDVLETLKTRHPE